MAAARQFRRAFLFSSLAVVHKPLSHRSLHLSRAVRDDLNNSSEIAPANDHWKLIETDVSSLRTDNIAAAGLGLSRR